MLEYLSGALAVLLLLVVLAVLVVAWSLKAPHTRLPGPAKVNLRAADRLACTYLLAAHVS